METIPKDTEKHDSDKQHQIDLVLSEYSALRLAYQQAIDDLDAPVGDLLIPHFAKPPSKFFRFVLSYHPYFTQKKFIRYFVEVHVRTRLVAIRKAFERLNRLNADEPFKSAVEGIERWVDDLQHPITLNGLLRISVPPAILFALTQGWKHFGPPHALDSISPLLTDYLGIALLSFAVSVPIGMACSFLGVSFKMKRNIFFIRSVYAEEREFSKILKGLVPKLKRRTEFPTDLLLGLFPVLLFDTAFTCLLLFLWKHDLDHNRTVDEFNNLILRYPDLAVKFPNEHYVKVFNGPLWAWCSQIFPLFFVISALIAYIGRRLGKHI